MNSWICTAWLNSGAIRPVTGAMTVTYVPKNTIRFTNIPTRTYTHHTRNVLDIRIIIYHFLLHLLQSVFSLIVNKWKRSYSSYHVSQCILWDRSESQNKPRIDNQPLLDLNTLVEFMKLIVRLFDRKKYHSTLFCYMHILRFQYIWVIDQEAILVVKLTIFF